MSNFDTPEGRLAAAESLGPDGYNAAMKAHHKASEIATVNGYGIRSVASRFGRLFMVVGTDAAFSTIEAATAHANGLPPVRNVSLEVSRREDAFLIAAIRLWQQLETGDYTITDPNGKTISVRQFDDIASCGWEFEPLSQVEIDNLACDVFGCDPWLTDEERAALAT